MKVHRLSGSAGICYSRSVSVKCWELVSEQDDCEKHGGSWDRLEVGRSVGRGKGP